MSMITKLLDQFMRRGSKQEHVSSIEKIDTNESDKSESNIDKQIPWIEAVQRLRNVTVGANRQKYLRVIGDDICCKPCVFLFKKKDGTEYYCAKYDENFISIQIPTSCKHRHLSYFIEDKISPFNI